MIVKIMVLMKMTKVVKIATKCKASSLMTIFNNPMMTQITKAMIIRKRRKNKRSRKRKRRKRRKLDEEIAMIA